MSRKIDRRTLRTRASLLSAFRELVLTRGYESIDVRDIAERARVGRSTFYLHFSGKRMLLKATLDGPCSGLADCVGEGSKTGSLVPLLEHFRDQYAINRVFFEQPIRSLWVRHLATLIQRRLARAPAAAHASARLPASLLALTIAEMQVALIIHWLTLFGSVRPGTIAQALVTRSQALARR